MLVVLQPAEEVGEGARAVLESGALDEVAAIFGGHVDRRFEVGQVVAQAGALAASTDTFEIELTGAGAHGARPHESADPIVAAAAIVTALQTLVSRRLDPAQPGVVTVGTINAGTASNIIPDRARLTGTIRATTRRRAHAAHARAASAWCRAVAAAYGVSATTTLSGGTPPIVNPPEHGRDRRAAGHARARRRRARAARHHQHGRRGFRRVHGEHSRLLHAHRRARAGGRVIAAHSPGYYAAEGALFIGAAVLAETARAASAKLAGGA